MADIVDSARRSAMMGGIRGRNTQPEWMIRAPLHKRGLRYRLHDARLPGKPDLVFGPRRAVVFIHGCFWHGHECALFKWPATRAAFWKEKIEGNRRRDLRVGAELEQLGWRQARVWECALKGRNRLDHAAVIEELAAWLDGTAPHLTIRGHQ